MTGKENRQMVKNGEIYAEWRAWRESAPSVEDRWPSERFGELMLEIAENLLRSPRFRGYPEDEKDDMRSLAVLKMMRNIRNVREERRGSLFSYFTLCAQCAFLTYLRRKYRRAGAIEDYARMAECGLVPKL